MRTILIRTGVLMAQSQEENEAKEVRTADPTRDGHHPVCEGGGRLPRRPQEAPGIGWSRSGLSERLWAQRKPVEADTIERRLKTI